MNYCKFAPIATLLLLGVSVSSVAQAKQPQLPEEPEYAQDDDTSETHWDLEALNEQDQAAEEVHTIPAPPIPGVLEDTVPRAPVPLETVQPRRQIEPTYSPELPYSSDEASCEECAVDCEDCEDAAGDLEEPSRLFDDCCYLKRHGLNIYGWVGQGFTTNPEDPADRFNGPVTFNDRSNDYQLNQVYAVIEKPLDLEENCWDIGGRVDLLYGTDFRFTLARGLDAERSDGTPRWNSNRFYGLAMPQAYGEFGYNNFTVKAGHFYTIIGYEVVTEPDNFFYSHAYTMQYGEPFTHTGAIGTYKFNDQFSVTAGFTNGWDTFDDVNTEQSFIGGLNFSSSDESHKLALTMTSGDEPSFGGELDNRTLFSLVYTSVVSDKLTYILQHDNGLQTEGSDNGTNDAQWYGVNQYLIYQINACWSAGIRAEWFRDDDGTRVAPVGDFGDNGTGVNANAASVGGFEGNFYAVTGGLNYHPTANLKIRPELRYDVFDGRATNGVLPFDDGTKDDQFLAAFDIIYQW